MDNKKILEEIEKGRDSTEKANASAEKRLVKMIIFLITGKRYALYAEDIREIILDYPLFYVPFVPPYVRGFINRHGEPYTVLDLNVLFEQTVQNSSAYLVLNRSDDQLALIISEIQEIIRLPEDRIHFITEDTGEDGYFTGSISGETDEEIFIVNLERVLERLSRDLSAG